MGDIYANSWIKYNFDPTDLSKADIHYTFVTEQQPVYQSHIVWQSIHILVGIFLWSIVAVCRKNYDAWKTTRRKGFGLSGIFLNFKDGIGCDHNDNGNKNFTDKSQT